MSQVMLIKGQRNHIDKLERQVEALKREITAARMIIGPLSTKTGLLDAVDDVTGQLVAAQELLNERELRASIPQGVLP